jgi:hypothetical protein
MSIDYTQKTRKPNADVLSRLFCRVFGSFSARGVRKDQQKKNKNILPGKGPPKKIGDPRGGWVGQRPKKKNRVGFRRFSAREVQKHHKNMFAKSPCRKLFPKKIDKNFDVSFFLDFFIAFSFVSQQWELKKLQNKIAKQIVSKSFLQKIRPKIQTDFFSICFYHIFRRFSVRRV